MSEENTYTIKPLYLGKMLDFEKSVYTYRTDYGVKMDTPFMEVLQPLYHLIRFNDRFNTEK